MTTDHELQRDVKAELDWDPSVHADAIAVAVHHGTVTLSGTVCSYFEKWNADSAARRVHGVKGLRTELQVRLHDTHRRSDADIEASVRKVLEWTTALPHSAIRVAVSDGWVTLTGRADWQFQRQAALGSVRRLIGVTGVSDAIDMSPAVTLSAVRGDIEAALRRSATADAQQIAVRIDGAEVTLSGTVHSWAQRDTATSSAWGTPGVLNVIDDMTLSG